MPDSNWSLVSTFLLLTALFVQPHKHKSKGDRSGDSNSSTLVTTQNYTQVYDFFFSQWPILSTPTILTFPPESPCIWLYPSTPRLNKKVTLSITQSVNPHRDNCALLRYHAASSDNFFPTFRDNLSVSYYGASSANFLPKFRDNLSVPYYTE